MVREIQIGERMERFDATGALPITYRELTGRDLFEDQQKLQDGPSDVTLDIAWAMHREANPEDDACSMKEWMRQFSYMDIINALPEILEKLTESERTASVAKKNNGQ